MAGGLPQPHYRGLGTGWEKGRKKDQVEETRDCRGVSGKATGNPLGTSEAKRVFRVVTSWGHESQVFVNLHQSLHTGSPRVGV